MIRWLTAFFFSIAVVIWSNIAVTQIGQIPDYPTKFNVSTVAYNGPCDVTSCASAGSMTHSPLASYTGPLFQLENGTTTYDVPQVNHVVDTSGIPAFCKVAGTRGCRIRGTYDAISGNLIPSISSTTGAVNAPATCTAGSGAICGAPYWIDPSTGLPVLVTVYPSEYDANVAGINGGANPTSLYYYGRNELYPAEIGIGHDPGVPNINGTNMIAMIDFTDRSINFGYLRCNLPADLCGALDEETSVGPYSVSTAPGGIGAAYTNAAQQTDIHGMVTWNGVAGAGGVIKHYINNATPIYIDSPPASVQFDSSAFLPGKHFKIGAGGDGVQSSGIFRDWLVTNSTLTATDYNNLSNNIDNWYAGHATPAACRGSADVDYFMPGVVNAYADWDVYEPQSSGFQNWAVAQLRASYYGPIANLSNGTTTQDFTGAIAAGGSGCGLDPAASSFCTGGSLGHCELVIAYGQGVYNGNGIGNTHDSTQDLTCASGHRPRVDFNSLNGLPTMHWFGDEACISGSPVGGGNAQYFGFGVVGKQTGNFGAVNNYADFGAGNYQIASPASADSIGFWNGITFQTFTGAAYNNNHWHYFYMEHSGSNWTPRADGVDLATFSNQGSLVNTGVISIGKKSDGSQPLIGDIAEVHAVAINSSVAAGFLAHGATLFSLMQNRWGTLPN